MHPTILNTEIGDGSVQRVADGRSSQHRAARATERSADTVIDVCPVLFGTVGSWSIKVILQLHQRLSEQFTYVPFALLAFDTVKYTDFVNRMVSEGFDRDFVEGVIPRSRYVELDWPFDVDFDFDEPLNRSWLSTISDDSLRRIVAQREAAGAAKCPAVGKARVEAARAHIVRRVERVIRELTARTSDTLNLKRDVLVYMVTTFRGGTGTGGTTPIAGLLKNAFPYLKIHATILMPCIFGHGVREKANAYQQYLEIRHVHRYDVGRVPMRGGDTVAPFRTVRPLFSYNGRHSIGEADALAGEVEYLLWYLRPETQSLLLMREIDLEGLEGYDLYGYPSHIRSAIALSVETVNPDVFRYLTLAWTKHAVEQAHMRFETYLDDHAVTPAEENRLGPFVERAVSDLRLSLSALVAEITGANPAENRIREGLMRMEQRLMSCTVPELRQNVPRVRDEISRSFAQFEREWQQNARALSERLSRDIMDYVRSHYGSKPHLVLAAIERIREHLEGLGIHDQVERYRSRGRAANNAYARTLNDLQVAQDEGAIFKGRKRESARNIAREAIGRIRDGACARARQRVLESLQHALLSGPDAVVGQLARGVQTLTIDVRDRMRFLLERTGTMLDTCTSAIEKRSDVFQRTLIFGDADIDTLKARARALYDQHDDVESISQLLSGHTDDIGQVAEALQSAIPESVHLEQHVADLLQNDRRLRDEIVSLLRDAEAFTPVSRTVEDQQHLAERNDGFTILALPGGKESPLAAIMIREGVVTDENQIVASGGPIRLFRLRAGLSYYAIEPLLHEYPTACERYKKVPSNPSSHTDLLFRDLPHIERPTTSLIDVLNSLIARLMAIFDDVIIARPSGGFEAHYFENRHGTQVPATTHFESHRDLFDWLAKTFHVCKHYQERLKEALDGDSEGYKARLYVAWQNAEGEARYHLEAELHQLKVDLYSENR